MDENDDFVSAADFFRQQGDAAPAPAAKAEDLVQRKLPRESLLVVAKNSQVRNKISAFNSQQSNTGAPPFGRPQPVAPQRWAGAAPPLGTISEDAAAGGVVAAPPLRRHATVVSTATAAGSAPARKHAAAVDTAAPAVALPSPATKQQVAEKRQESRFPSIMFRPSEPGTSRLTPLSSSSASTPPQAAAVVPSTQQEPGQLRPLPAVLAGARASLSPRKQPYLVEGLQDAAAPVKEPAAASGEAGAVSREGSEGHVVIDDDACSVASDASTVVPDHDHSGEWEQGTEPAELPDGAAALAPVPNDWALMEEPERVHHAVVSTLGAPHSPHAAAVGGQLFQSATNGLPPLECVASGRTSLSPAVPARRRRSSLCIGEEQVAAASLAGGIAEAVAAAGKAAVATPGLPSSASAEAPVSAFSFAPPPAEEQPTAEPEAQAAGPTEGSAPQAEGSRLSVVSSAATHAPSLNIEFSEASLRYSVDQTPRSPRSQQSLEISLPEFEAASAAASATVQQRLSLPGQPTARTSTFTVSPLTVQEHQQVNSTSPAMQPAADAVPEADSTCLSPAAARIASLATLGVQAAAGSPAPATPYAATEYDGDDVVMMDVDSPLRATTVRRTAPRSSRFQLEALASAGLAVAQSPIIVACSLTAANADELAGTSTAEEAAPAMTESVVAAPQAEEREDQVPASSLCFPAQHSDAATPVQAAAAGGDVLPAEEHGAPTVVPPAVQQEQDLAEHAASPLVSAPPADIELSGEQAGAAGEQVLAAVVAAPVVDQAGVPPSSAELPAEQQAASDRRASISRIPRLSLPAGLSGGGVTGHVSRPGNSRLSLPGSFGMAESGQGSRTRNSRLSLPASLAHEDADAFSACPKLAMSPPAAPPRCAVVGDGEAAACSQVEEEQETEQPQEQLEAADQQEVAGAAEETYAPPFAMRSRLSAEDEEMPALGVPEPAAASAGSLSSGAAAAEPVEQPTVEQSLQPEAAFVLEAEFEPEPAVAKPEPAVAEPEPAVAEPEPAVAAAPEPPTCDLELAQDNGSSSQQDVQPQREDGQGQVNGEEAFAAKPKLAMSPVLSTGAAGRNSVSGDTPVGADDAAAFATRPKLAMSPAFSSGSVRHTEEVQDTAVSVPAEPEPAQEQPSEAEPSLSYAPIDQQPAQSRRESGVQLWGAESPTMSSNPLAGAGNTPLAASRRFSHSPAPSGLSASGISNNPLYAGTPSHPTPPSVNLKSFTGRGASAAGTPHSTRSTPASTGIKLAEKLHQVAEQLQNPAAPQGLAALATPGGARMAVMSQAPRGSEFEFADDVAAVMQALDASTPATAMGQRPALARALAAATTVQRPGGARVPRYSFAAANTLLDLDGYDANGNKSASMGTTPLLRQQLLAGTPATMGPAAAHGDSQDQGAQSRAPAAGTPEEEKARQAEVEALRKQVAEMQSQREEMVGLLGGYQSSIQELQDKHSVLVVRLQGENAALKTELDDLKRTHGGVDSQFRALYHDKYVPLKAEAAGLRQELAALQKRVLAEELMAHKAASEVQAARQELAAVQERVQSYKAAMLEQQAEANSARDMEQRLQQQLAAEQRRADKVLAARDAEVAGKEAEVADLRSKYNALTKQYDEAVHRINLAKQARERAQAEVHRKEDEVVALEVRLKEYEAALREYKKENSKFFEMKERYKATIAGLEKEVQAKEREKQELLQMCNELLTRLEREGLSA